MKRLRTWVCVALIAAFLLSLVCVCSLYAYPTHTHETPTQHCILCAIATHASFLLHGNGADAKPVSLLFLLLLFALCAIVVCLRPVRRQMTPVCLKTKLTI